MMNPIYLSDAMKNRRPNGVLLKSTMTHTGRIAGTGIIEDKYDENSFLDFKPPWFRDRTIMFVQKLKPAEEPCICYKLREEELAEVLKKCKRGEWE